MTPIKIKAGVRVFGLRPELLLAIQIAHSVFQDHAELEMRITSVIDGKHSVGSLHYAGQAVDISIAGLNTDFGTIKAAIAEALGADYDVVLETDHLHIEFQPKQPYG